MGVEQEEVEGEPASRGVVSRALHSVEGLLRDSYYSTSIYLALFMLRELVADSRVACSSACFPVLQGVDVGQLSGGLSPI